MSRVLRLILYPGQRKPDPAPLAVDLTGVFLIGIGAWVIALIVTWFRWRAGSVPLSSTWTCLAGTLLGIIAVAWARFDRRRRAASSSI